MFPLDTPIVHAWRISLEIMFDVTRRKIVLSSYKNKSFKNCKLLQQIIHFFLVLFFNIKQVDLAKQSMWFYFIHVQVVCALIFINDKLVFWRSSPCLSAVRENKRNGDFVCSFSHCHFLDRSLFAYIYELEEQVALEWEKPCPQAQVIETEMEHAVAVH